MSPTDRSKIGRPDDGISPSRERSEEPSRQPSPEDDAELRSATVLFADISGFTALSEKLDPEEVREVMNACFRKLERIVVDCGGSIDKYIGDCVMALFGAPRALEGAARLALNAALEIREGIAALNISEGFPVPLGVHIGVNSGRVVAGNLGGDEKRDFTVLGAAVNLAARLYDHAKTGEILVGPTTYWQAIGSFEFRTREPVAFKGIAEKVPVFELLRELPDRAAAHERSHPAGEQAKIIGRDTEIAQIAALAEDLVRGKGFVLTIVGDAGVGKSKVLDEARQAFERSGVTFCRLQARMTGGSIPYRPFSEFLRSWMIQEPSLSESKRAQVFRDKARELLGEDNDNVAALVRLAGLQPLPNETALLAGLTPEAVDRLTHHGFSEFLFRLAAREPLALVVEDAQWADPSSVGLLEDLLPLAPDSRIGFVLVTRPTEDRAWQSPGSEEGLAQHHHLMQLGPLDAGSSNALLEELLGTDSIPAGVRSLVIRTAAGNPLFMAEVVRAMFEQGLLVRDKGRVRATTSLPSIELPTGVESVVISRVERLSDAARRLLGIASVLGMESPVTLLERVSGLPKEELAALLRELEQREFVELDAETSVDDALLSGPRFRFRHALLQQTVYETLLKKTRRQIHHDAAMALESSPGTEHPVVRLGMLAYHYSRSDDREKAEVFLIAAGEAAAAAATSAEALEYFREAYRMFLSRGKEDTAAPRLALLERNIATALLNTGRLSESIDHFDRALRLYGYWIPATDRSRTLNGIADLARVVIRLYAGRLGRVRVRASGTPSDSRAVVRCFYDRCRAVNPTDPERSFFYNLSAMRYLAWVDRDNLEEAAGIYASAAAFFAFAGLSFSVARRFLGVAQSLVREGNAVDEFRVLAMRSVVDFHDGSWDGTNDMPDDVYRAGLRAGLTWDANTYLGMVCERAIRQGALEVAQAQIARLCELDQDYGYRFAGAHAQIMGALMALESSDEAGARACVERFLAERHEDSLKIFGLSTLARIDLLSDASGALAAVRIEEARRIASRAGRLAPFYASALAAAELAVCCAQARTSSAGKKTDRRSLRVMREAIRASSGIARDQPMVHRLAGLILWESGKQTAAVGEWRRAMEAARRLGALPEIDRVLATSESARALAPELDWSWLVAED